MKGTLHSLQSVQALFKAHICSAATPWPLPRGQRGISCSSAHANILALACAGVFLGADAKHGCCVCDSHSREGCAQFNA